VRGPTDTLVYARKCQSGVWLGKLQEKDLATDAEITATAFCRGDCILQESEILTDDSRPAKKSDIAAGP